jgi:hypothetical protein
LKKGLEKTSEKQDNNFGISCLAFWIFIGCSPFLVKVSGALSLANYRSTAFFIHPLKSARL